MEIFYNFPISILRNGITENALYEMLYYATYRLNIDYYDGNATQQDIEQGLGYSILEPFDDCMHTAEEIYKAHCECNAMTGISKNRYWDWRKNINNESDYSKTLLLAFLAAKSQLGFGKKRKRFCKTNYLMLFSRMAGRKSPEYYTPSNGKNKGERILRLPEHLKPYYFSRNGKQSRRKCDSIRDGLKSFNIFWDSYKGQHGFALSNTNVSAKELHRLLHTPSKTVDEKRREYKERIAKGIDLEPRHLDNEPSMELTVEEVPPRGTDLLKTILPKGVSGSGWDDNNPLF